jgi:hypothetical protein
MDSEDAQVWDDVETDQIAFIRDTAFQRYKMITSVHLTSSLGKNVSDTRSILSDLGLNPCRRNLPTAAGDAFVYMKKIPS